MIYIWELWKFWSNIRVIYTVSGRRTTGHGHGGTGGREAEAALHDGDRCGVVADAREGAGGRDVVLGIHRAALPGRRGARRAGARSAGAGAAHIARSVLALGDMERLRSIGRAPRGTGTRRSSGPIAGLTERRLWGDREGAVRLAKQRGIHCTPENWERIRRRARKDNETISRFGELCCLLFGAQY